MQNDKLLNIGSTVRDGRIYSIEFHEDVQQNGVKLQVEAGCDTQIIPNFIMIALL